MTLSHKDIIKNLDPLTHQLIPTIRIESSVTSTNDILLSEKTTQNTALFADTQTLGRGQFDRAWISPPNTNLYFSLAWHFKKPIVELLHLSLLIAQRIQHALTTYGISGVTIKHPNDLMFHDKKLGGILIETTELKTNATLAIIGIGLNINLENSDKINQPWTSLKQMTQTNHDRNLIAALLLNSICDALNVLS
jgi:BirA family biotin operon repressor/biotin-[acetyl-CoA-carboxylase] ligase